MANKNRSIARIRRHARVRKHVVGTPERPRLNVFRSITEIYAQVIDDIQQKTLVGASSRSKELKGKLKKAESKSKSSLGKSTATLILETSFVV